MRIFTIFFLVMMTAEGIHAGNWTTFRGDMTRKGYSRNVVLVPQKKGKIWDIRINAGIISSPVIQDSIAYIGARDNNVYAISTKTGAIKWQRQTGGWIDASPLVNGTNLIVGSRDGFIYVLDRNTGSVVQRYQAGIQISSPGLTDSNAVVSGLGYPANALAKLSAVSASDTTIAIKDTLSFSQPTFSSPALSGNVAVIGNNNGFFNAVDLRTMKTIWTFQTNGAVLASTPAIDDSVVYFSSCDWDRNIYAVDLAKGAIYWENDGLSKNGMPKKSVPPDMIGSSDFLRLLKYDPQTRTKRINQLRKSGMIVPSVLDNPVLAKQSSASAAPAFYGFGDIKASSVAVDSNNVYVVQREDGYPSSQFTLLALDKYFGDFRWYFSEQRLAKPLWLCSSPCATPKLIFAGWGEGKIYGFDPKNGAILWQDSLSDDIVSSPAISGDRLIVAALNGQVSAFGFDTIASAQTFGNNTYCYPNPARGNVSHIQLYAAKSATMDMTLYNTAEKPVLRFSRHFSANDKFTYDWNLAGTANGVYFALIKVKYDDGTNDRKVLKVAVLK
jgi:outer membrane protein assembly factor BamB